MLSILLMLGRCDGNSVGFIVCVCVFVLWDGCLISFSYGGYCFTIGLRKLYSLLQYFFFFFLLFIVIIMVTVVVGL